MRAAILLLLAALLLSGCSAGSQGQTTMTAEQQFSFLALGDSYTVGQSVPAAEGWPVQLAAALREEGIAMGEPTIIARTGWTTGDLLRGIEAQGEMESYDLVSLLIGVNDQFQVFSIEGYQQRFRELLGIAIRAAGERPERVLVLSIPDWEYTPYAESIDRQNISAEIDAFNGVNRAESEAAGVHYFDITPTTRPVAFDAALFAEDGLHPSAKMYALWVDLVLPYVVELFAGE